MSEKHDDWDEWLPYAVFTYHTLVHSSTNFTPFYLLHRYEAQLPIDNVLKLHDDLPVTAKSYARKVLEKLVLAREDARHNAKQAQTRQMWNYNRKRKDSPFKEGDQVWIFSPYVKRGRSRKFMHKWHGPFII